MKVEIGIEFTEEMKEALANMSESERSALIAKVLLKTAQDIKTEEDKTSTSAEL